jgi:hypothetical protein
MALVSPHRAIATAAFSTGVPLRLLEQLSPLRPGFIGRQTETERTWLVSLAALTEKPSRRHLALKLAADAIIVGLAAIMLWRYWVINSGTMIQWKCESPLLVFLWYVSSKFT